MLASRAGPVEFASVHNGYVAAVAVGVASHGAAASYDRGSLLLLWAPSSSTNSAITGLNPDTGGDFSIKLAGGREMLGVTLKALVLEDDPATTLSTVFVWSSEQIMLFQVTQSSRGGRPVFTLVDAVECGVSAAPTILVISEDASHCASVEQNHHNRNIIIRCNQLRRRQVISAPDDENSTIAAVSFLQADVHDILFALRNGAVYVSKCLHQSCWVRT
jgi:hypothetical protein